MHYYSTNYTKPTQTNTDYTKPAVINTAWNVFGNRSTYGEAYGLTTRVLYGDHVVFGVSKINYKFINTNYST